MKSTTIIPIMFTLLLSLDLYSTPSQVEQKNDEIYISPEFGYGNYWNVGINLNYTYEQSISFKIETSWMWKKASSTPNNYNSGLVRLAFYSPFPLDHLTHIQFNIGKIVYLNRIETIRLNISLGIAATSICEPQDWEPKNNSPYLGINENYYYEHHEYETVSFVISPSIEFPVINNFGFNITPMYLANKDSYFIGVKVGLMLGYLK